MVSLSIAINDPSTVAMVIEIEIHALERKVWWASFGEDMAALREKYASLRRLDRDTWPCLEAFWQMVLEWLTSISYCRAIQVSDHYSATDHRVSPRPFLRNW